GSLSELQWPSEVPSNPELLLSKYSVITPPGYGIAFRLLAFHETVRFGAELGSLNRIQSNSETVPLGANVAGWILSAVMFPLHEPVICPASNPPGASGFFISNI